MKRFASFFKKILFIHETHTHTHTHRSRDRQREKQAPYREPDAGLDPGTTRIRPWAEGRR